MLLIVLLETSFMLVEEYIEYRWYYKHRLLHINIVYFVAVSSVTTERDNFCNFDLNNVVAQSKVSDVILDTAIQYTILISKRFLQFYNEMCSSMNVNETYRKN